MSTPSETDAVCSCKVSRVAADEGLVGVHEELRERWTEPDGPSVRELTDEFNKRVLKTALRSAGTLPIDGEIDNVYRLLSDDDVGEAERVRARQRLQQNGVDTERVEAELVSHQTMYRHLRNCLDTEYEGDTKTPAERLAEWSERVQALKSRTSAVTMQGVEHLDRHGAVDINTPSVSVDITVSCDECGAFFSAEEFLDEGACDCVQQE
jgi:hypothetical protein